MGKKEEGIVRGILKEREKTHNPEEDNNPGEYLETEGEGIFKKISLSSIVTDRQPRKTISEESLKELAQSLEKHGLINPIEVVPTETFGKYKLVSGHRRLEAARSLGWKKIMAKIVSHIDPVQDILPRQLVENLQREDLDPIDEALALAQLNERGLSHQEIANLVGKSKPRVTFALRVTALILKRFAREPVISVSDIPPEDLRKAKEELGKIPKDTLIELAGIADKPYFEDALSAAKEGTPRKEIMRLIKEKERKEKTASRKTNTKSYEVSKAFSSGPLVKFNSLELSEEEIKPFLEALDTAARQLKNSLPEGAVISQWTIRVRRKKSNYGQKG